MRKTKRIATKIQCIISSFVFFMSVFFCAGMNVEAASSHPIQSFLFFSTSYNPPQSVEFYKNDPFFVLDDYSRNYDREYTLDHYYPSINEFTSDYHMYGDYDYFYTTALYFGYIDFSNYDGAGISGYGDQSVFLDIDGFPSISSFVKTTFNSSGIIYNTSIYVGNYYSNGGDLLKNGVCIYGPLSDRTSHVRAVVPASCFLGNRLYFYVVFRCSASAFYTYSGGSPTKYYYYLPSATVSEISPTLSGGVSISDYSLEGYQNGEMGSASTDLNNSLSGYEQAEGSLFTSANQGVGSFQFQKLDTPALISSMSFVSTFLQSIYTSSGGLNGLGLLPAVVFTFTFASIVVGLYRYYGGGKSG